MFDFRKQGWFLGVLLLTIGIILAIAYVWRQAYCFKHIYQYPEWHYVSESRTYKQSDADGKHNIKMYFAEWHVQQEIGRCVAWTILFFFVFGIWALFIDFLNLNKKD